MTNLAISLNENRETDNWLLIIVNRFTKMVYYDPVKVTIEALGQAIVIIKAEM